MEEGVTIAKVPDWMVLKPEMMAHLIREHEKLGRTLTEEETVTLLRSLGFESVRRNDEEQQVSSAVRFCHHTFPLRSFILLRRRAHRRMRAISWSR